MRITTEPRSDQWNADDFIGGPRTFTIAGVKVGVAEQKYDIELVEGEGRVWRPPITVLRLLVAALGDDSTTWPGRRVRLYRDPEISFGRDKVGGIRLSHLSGIDKPLSIMLTTTRGHRANHTVQPLVETAPTTAEHVETGEELTKRTRGQLFALFTQKGVVEDQQLPGANHILGTDYDSRSQFTEADGLRLIEVLLTRPDVEPVEPTAEDAFPEPSAP